MSGLFQSGLFRRDLEKHCLWCAHGAALDEGKVLCRQRGVVDDMGCCRHYAYDPLRRVPPRPLTLRTEKFSPEEFML